jgi:hypothetical protein
VIRKATPAGKGGRADRLGGRIGAQNTNDLVDTQRRHGALPDAGSQSLRVAIGAAELRVTGRPAPKPTIEVRWWTLGGGPAAVMMPSNGITFPAEDAAEVIAAIKSAELRLRQARLGVGGTP